MWFAIISTLKMGYFDLTTSWRRLHSACFLKAVITLLFLGLTGTSFAQTDTSLRLVSPIGTMARSTFVPGWGQLHARNYLQGTIAFVGVGGCLVGAFIANKSFRDAYDNDYLPVVSQMPNSPEADFQYNRVNQRFKVRQFFLLTAVGIWAYNLIDAYVGANLYNAQTKADRLIEDAVNIEKLGMQIDITPTQLHLSLVKSF